MPQHHQPKAPSVVRSGLAFVCEGTLVLSSAALGAMLAPLVEEPSGGTWCVIVLLIVVSLGVRLGLVWASRSTEESAAGELRPYPVGAGQGATAGGGAGTT